MSKKLFRAVAAVIVLALALTLFAACNLFGDNSDDFGDESVDMSEDIKKLVEQSRSEFDTAFNYYLQVSESIDSDEYVAVTYTCMADTTGSMEINGSSVYLIFTYYPIEGADEFSEETDHSYAVYFYSNENLAKSMAADGSTLYEEWSSIKREGNKVILSGGGTYEAAQKSKRPNKLTKNSKQVVDFVQSKLHRGLDKREALSQTFVELTREGGHANFASSMNVGNCEINEIVSPIGVEFETVEEAEETAKNFEKYKSTNYTDDSFFKIDKAAGLVSCRLIDKPGWNIYYEEDGAYIAEYYYDSEQSTVTVPTKVGNYTIFEAKINRGSSDSLDIVFGHIIVPAGLDRVTIYVKCKELTLPANDNVSFNSDALETVHFGGTTRQWEEMYEDIAARWDHKVTVACTNGTLTYPKTEA